MNTIIIRNNNSAFLDNRSHDNFDANSSLYLTPFSEKMVILPKEGIYLTKIRKGKVMIMMAFSSHAKTER